MQKTNKKIYEKAPFGVCAKRFYDNVNLISRCKIYVSPAQYNICSNIGSCKTKNFIYPSFNTTAERFIFDKNSFVNNLNHRFYLDENIKSKFYDFKENRTNLKIIGNKLKI